LNPVQQQQFAALTPLFIVPTEIWLRSALVRSDDREAIILFSANEGLSFANLTKSLGDFASSVFRKQLVFFHTCSELLDF
jgi:hypothetical protein